MGIEFRTSTDFSKTSKHLSHLARLSISKKLRPWAERGVKRLADSTPRKTGATAMAWHYKIETDRNGATIKFLNNNAPDGACVAILIQNGHASLDGTFKEGIDYINPALKPVFDGIVDMIQKEVREA